MKNLIMKNRLLMVFSLFLLCCVASELFARFVIGTGNPILIMDHPTIGYMARPSQSGSQLHNHYYYNSFGMRSAEFQPQKSDPSEIRVLLIGDSILAGGVHTDQNELASEIVKNKLSSITGRPVVVANISCGGWGPQNQLEYIREFGTFDADIAIWVLSSHDCDDYVPSVSFAGDSSSFPSSKPFCASIELLEKSGIISDSPVEPCLKTLSQNERKQLNKNCVEQMAQLLGNENVDLVLVQHLTVNELVNSTEPGFDLIGQWADDNDIEKINLSSIFKQNIGSVQSYYRDNVHINASGQKIYADAMTELILDHLN